MFPFTLSIYARIEYKNVVFPEPTLPITLTNWPRWILSFGISKVLKWVEAAEEAEELDWLCRSLYESRLYVSWLELDYFFFVLFFFFLGLIISPSTPIYCFFFLLFFFLGGGTTSFFSGFLGALGGPFFCFSASPYLWWFLTKSLSHWNTQSLNSISPVWSSWSFSLMPSYCFY